MNSRIITKPTVTLVGSTQLNYEGLQEFASNEGLEEVARDPSTPLYKIAATALGDGEYTSEEVMPEFGGRFCYRSFAKGRTTEAYNENILNDKHGSVLEHSTLNLVLSGISRSLTHELVRHRVGIAISQESQRYVDARLAKVVMPPLLVHYLKGDTECGEAKDFMADFQTSIDTYERWQEWYRLSIMDDDLLSDVKAKTAVKKRVNEAARAHLPLQRVRVHALQRTLRQFVMTRGADPADLEIRRLAVDIAKVCIDTAPTIFSDIEFATGDFGVPTITGQHWKV